MLSPYIIGDSLIFDLNGKKVQIGSVTVKELSAHHQDIPSTIILRPEDNISIELNFYHSFFVEQSKLTVYASKDQVNRINEVMQLSLYAGEKDWGYKNVCSFISSIDDELFRQKLKKLADEYYEKEDNRQTVINELEEIKSEIPSSVLAQFRLFFAYELSKKAFPVLVHGHNVQQFIEIPDSYVNFIEYDPADDIEIDGFFISVDKNRIKIIRDEEILFSSDYSIRTPSNLILERYPVEYIREIADKNRHKLVRNGVAQIGSGDGLAFTPDQDTSCALIRQSGKTYLIDASVKSILSCAKLGINVYEDDIVALLTHGCHGDHGAGLYFIARIRACIGKKLTVFGHPRVFNDYIKKSSNLYKNEFTHLRSDQIKRITFSFLEYSKPNDVYVTPLNTHSVPTAGFYFSKLNYYITGDMSGAELRDNKMICSKDIDIRSYYFKHDLKVFERTFEFVKDDGMLAIESGHPPIHVPRDIIVEILGGQDEYDKKLKKNQLFIYHTSGQKDATAWISLD